MNMIMVLLVTISAVWVYWDATSHKIGKIEGAGGALNMSAGAWGTVTLLLWIVGFPCYLIKRGDLIKAAQEHPVEVNGRGGKTAVFVIIGLLMVLGTWGGGSAPVGSDASQASIPVDTAAAPAPAQSAAPAEAAADPSDVSVDDVKVETDSDGGKEIVGVATNNTDKVISYVEVDFNLYDKSGAQLDSTMTNVNNLDAHGKWKFSAPITDDKVDSFKLKGVTAY